MTSPNESGERVPSDSLMQKDIDQLLQASPAAVAVRAAPPPEVTAYDFLRPPRISRERRVQLDAIFARFALATQSMFSSRLRVAMDVSCTIEQATFSEYVLQLRHPCAAFVLSLGGSRGQGAIDLTTDLAFYLVDRAFGGPGEVTPIPRGLTALERTVAEGFVEKLLALLQDAWQEHIAFELAIAGFETIPDMLQVADLEDNVLVANVEVRAGEFRAQMSICIPLQCLESFLVEKGSSRARALHLGSPAQQQAVERAVRDARVDVAVRFPLLRLSAREVAGLRPGNVIQTAQPIDGPIELHINGVRRFVGQLGQYRRMLGLRVTEPVTPARERAARGSRGKVK